MPLTYARAKALFTALGANDPASLASSETKEGRPALARFLFMKALWSCAISDDPRWITSWANPTDAVPAAMKRMLALGVDPADLTDVVRAMQVEVLFNVCCILDSSSHGIEDLQAKVPENVEWRLAEYDGETETLKRPILDVHESFHAFDPTGRGGEPRGAAKPKAKARAKPRRPSGKK
ncbi:MAG: hypothetical protein IPQ07_12330 [Myxococcales bacterium]|nr:hypothetical protein [Myxococcales bacterium]